MSNKVGLTPIWYTLRNQLAYTLGKTPGVVVQELQEGVNSGEYILRIDVSTCKTQAEAIRLVIPQEYTFGSIKVITEVNLNGTLVTIPNLAITTIEQLMDILKNALWCNPLVNGLINVAGQIPPVEQGTVGSIVVVISPTVIQFFNDDLSNLCNNYIEVASKVFQEVFNLSYGTTPIIISFTTYDCKCMKNAIIAPVCYGGCRH